MPPRLLKNWWLPRPNLKLGQLTSMSKIPAFVEIIGYTPLNYSKMPVINSSNH
jgi:hypothetical protein